MCNSVVDGVEVCKVLLTVIGDVCRSLQYNDLSNRVIGLTKDDVPVDLKKKVTLLIYFSQYMDEHLIYGADLHPSKTQTTLNCSPSPVSAVGVFLKKWFRTERAIVMHLSNGTLQVCETSLTDKDLFDNMSRPLHCLHHLLPRVRSIDNLRDRGHSFRARCTNAQLTSWLANRGLTLTAQLTRCRVARSTVN